jgi:MFS family permease
MFNFFALVATQTLSLVGSRMTSIGVGIWLFLTTGNTAPLLLMAFINELPGVLGSGPAGVLVDRWPRRTVLILADTGQAAASVLLLLSFLSGRFQIWQLYGIVLAQGIFAIFQGPAKDAAVTMLVPEQHRERANAIQQMAFPLAGVLAPVLTGALYAAVGIAGIILIDLATFLVAVAVLFRLHIPQPGRTIEGLAAQGSFREELQGGFRFLRRRRALLLLVGYIVLITFLLNGPLELSIPYLIKITGDEAVMGVLMGVSSAGALAGAALIAAWGGTRPRIHTLLSGLLLTGAMFLFYGTARTPVALGAVLFLLMAPLPISNALFISLLQIKSPPDMQGRIFGLFSQLSFLGATLSFLLVGPLVDQVLEPAVGRLGWELVAPFVGRGPGSGIGLLLATVGLIILVTTGVIYALPAIRSLEADLPDYAVLEAETYNPHPPNG